MCLLYRQGRAGATVSKTGGGGATHAQAVSRERRGAVLCADEGSLDARATADARASRHLDVDVISVVI